MALLLIFVGCSEEVVKIDQPIIGENPTRTIKVKATVGDDEIGTRVAMAQDGFDVNLTWEEGDVINLVFTDGTNTFHNTTTVDSITNNGRRAEFEILVPAEITSPTFNLYGYYGGGSLSTVTGEEGFANLPSGPWGMPMPALEAEDLVMLRFAATNLDANSPELSVSFQHVGSLFKIFLENTSTTSLSNVNSVEIFTESASDVIYAHQNDGVTTVQYDVVNGEFVAETTTFLNSLPFITAGGSDDIGPSEVLEIWGWYPPSQEAGHAWPALKLRLTQNDSEVLETSGATTAKTAPTAIGRAYHFYATYDGSDLSLSNVYKQKLIDSRDMSQYNIIEIGNQTWMAENLKYYPQVYTIGDPAVGSATDPHYYVYGYNGGAQGPEDLQQFTLSGILYNWAAALNDETGSNANPSGVQGICPDGWHLPSEAEWQELIAYVGANPGNKLKDPLWWASGDTSYTNEFGFTARPGGVRQSAFPYYANMFNSGHWLTSNIVDAANLRGVTITDTGSAVTFVNAPKEFAGSVRCVKN